MDYRIVGWRHIHILFSLVMYSVCGLLGMSERFTGTYIVYTTLECRFNIRLV